MLSKKQIQGLIKLIKIDIRNHREWRGVRFFITFGHA